MIGVLIVDDHALMRTGIRRLLEDLPDIHVIGEAQDGAGALDFIKTCKPDVVLLDMKMPGIDGWEVTRRLRKSHPEVKVIAVTALSTESLPNRVLQLGAMGYLTKESGPQDLADAIRKVYQGERYLSAEIAQKIAINSLQTNQEAPFTALSEREMQVVLMIVQGLSVQSIADLLFLSTKTVNGYRYRIFRKLAIKNDVELAYFAIKHRLVDRPDAE